MAALRVPLAAPRALAHRHRAAQRGGRRPVATRRSTCARVNPPQHRYAAARARARPAQVGLGLGARPGRAEPTERVQCEREHSGGAGCARECEQCGADGEGAECGECRVPDGGASAAAAPAACAGAAGAGAAGECTSASVQHAAAATATTSRAGAPAGAYTGPAPGSASACTSLPLPANSSQVNTMYRNNSGIRHLDVCVCTSDLLEDHLSEYSELDPAFLSHDLSCVTQKVK